MVTYDPRGMNWEQWVSLMAELFAGQALGVLPEERWRDWADAFSGVGYFASSGCPDSKGFPTWQEWAARLVGIIAIDSSIAIGANNLNLPNSQQLNNQRRHAGVSS
jgi:hypothetical protein